MIILFSSLSIICSFFSIEEYWNVINIFSALFLLGLSYTKIKAGSLLYSTPIFVLIIKDIIWWIANVGINFSRLAILMSISGILKMTFDVIIIVMCIAYGVCIINDCSFDTKKRILLVQIICMVSRILLFLIPLIIYNSTYDNLYIEFFSLGSYVFIFAGYMFSLYKDLCSSK